MSYNPYYSGQPGQAGYRQQNAPPQYGHNAPPQYGQNAPPQYGQNAPPQYGGQNPPPYAPSGGYQSSGYSQGSYQSGPPPGPGVNHELWNWFQIVDEDHNGHITADELQRALMNGNWSPFNAETCRLMVGMFDRNRSGTIDVNEFAALWKYIQDWKMTFDRFDTDRSGNIDAGELHNAFQAFGYRLSPNFINLCMRVFDRRNTRNINFDDFIQCCVMLKALTDKFREKDSSQQGTIKIHYEEFLRMVLDNTLII